MADDILDLQRAFDDAELHADTGRLAALLADDFLSIGERGFQLDKRQWIDRHRVVIGAEGTGIHLDRPVPGEILKRLTYHPRRGLRPVKHVSEDGCLAHSLSVQGIYRLAEPSAADLEAVLAGAPGEPIRLHRPRKKPEIPADIDPLF